MLRALHNIAAITSSLELSIWATLRHMGDCAMFSYFMGMPVVSSTGSLGVASISARTKTII